MSTRNAHSQPLFIFPIIAGSVWCLALSVLLIYWLASGRPRLPTQIDPRIAFVSDIGALELKPFFVLCCCIVAISFVITVIAVHRRRYASHLGSSDGFVRWMVSCVSVAFGVLAGICLAGLSIFDAFTGGVHAFFLNTALGAIGGCGVCIAMVWRRQTLDVEDTTGLRRWCMANCVLTVCLVTIGLLFVASIAANQWFIGGILEWTITYLGAAWLITFTGFLTHKPQHTQLLSPEGRPLLS